MNLLKKLCLVPLVLLAASISSFAADAGEKLSSVLEEIAGRENSGTIVSTDGKGNVSEDGVYSYISDGTDVFLVKGSGDIPYEYTKIKGKDSDGKNIIYVVYGDKENAYYFEARQKKLATVASASDFFKNISLEELSDRISGYTVSYKSDVTISGVPYTAFFTYIADDRDFKGLDPVAAADNSLPDDGEPNEKKVAAPSTKQEKKESGNEPEKTAGTENEPDGAPSAEILRELLNRIIALEKSGRLDSKESKGIKMDTFSYLSDGKNHFVIESGWKIPYEYDLIASSSDDVPNVLYVTYGHATEEDFEIYDDRMESLVGYEDDKFFDVDLAEAWEEINGYTITLRDKVELGGIVYEVVFTDINDDSDEDIPDYLFTDGNTDDYEDNVPTQEDLDALYEYIIGLEKSGKLVNTDYCGVSTDDYSYLSDGNNVYLINDKFKLPFEYNRVASDVESVPNIIYVTYGHDQAWDRYYFSSMKHSLSGYEGDETFFEVDIEDAYRKVLGYTISYRKTVELNGKVFEVFFSDINDDNEEEEEDEEDEEDISKYWSEFYGEDEDIEDEYLEGQKSEKPAVKDDQEEPEDDEHAKPLNARTLEKLLDDFIAQINGRGYPSLLKTDKPYLIKQDKGRYILRTDGYTGHIEISDYLYTVQLYTADYETGLLVFGFASGSGSDAYLETLDEFIELGEELVDEKSVEQAHMSGQLVVTQDDIDSFLESVKENGYVFDKEVVVDGVKYHAYCIPMNDSSWDAGSSTEK